MDATQRVFSGQDNTGDALVYGGMGDTNLKLLNATLIDKSRGVAGVTTETTKKSKKAATGEEIKPDYYYQWTAEFQPRLNKLDEIGSQFYAKGIDPYDPSSGQIYVEFQKEQNKLANDMEVSAQLGEYHKSALAQINQGDKKYSKESVEAINSYFNRPFAEVKKDLMEGKTPPQLGEINTFDNAAYLKNLGGSIEVEEDYTSLGTIDGVQSYDKKSQRNPETIRTRVKSDYEANPQMAEYYNTFYENLAPGVKAHYTKKAKTTGVKPQVLAAQDLGVDSLQGKKRERQMHNVNDDYFWASDTGKQKIEKRKKIINTILTGANAAPNQKVSTEAKREISNLFVGKTINDIYIDSVTIEDGIVYGVGTGKKSSLMGGGQDPDQKIKLLDLKKRGMDTNRSARLLNQLLNDSGLEEIPSDYFDQMLEESVITITPTSKKTNTNTTPKKTEEEDPYQD